MLNITVRLLDLYTGTADKIDDPCAMVNCMTSCLTTQIHLLPAASTLASVLYTNIKLMYRSWCASSWEGAPHSMSFSGWRGTVPHRTTYPHGSVVLYWSGNILAKSATVWNINVAIRASCPFLYIISGNEMTYAVHHDRLKHFPADKLHNLAQKLRSNPLQTWVGTHGPHKAEQHCSLEMVQSNLPISFQCPETCMTVTFYRIWM